MDHYTNTALHHAETLPTKANTELAQWWLALNQELAKRSLPGALYCVARDYYERGHSPATAADDIAVQA
jgi:hypothetical protein